MWLLPIAGAAVQLTYNSAGYLIDQAGNVYDTDGASIYDSAGTYLGTFYNDGMEFATDTRNQVVAAAQQTAQAAAVSAIITGGIVILGLFAMIKVIK